MKRAVITLGLAVLATSAPADAHRGGPGGTGYVSTFSAVVPNVLGVNVNILGGDDRLRLSNYSGKTVVILGYEREPYLRFAKAGVFENVRSPATYLNRFRYPPAVAPDGSDASARPRWRRVARGVTFEWHDRRIHWMARKPPKAVREDRREPHLIFNWRVPGRAGGKPFAITGFLGYVPPRVSRTSGRDYLVPVAGAAFGAVALGALAVGAGARRRKRRAP